MVRRDSSSLPCQPSLQTGPVALPVAPLPVMLVQSGNRDGLRRRSLPHPSPLPLLIVRGDWIRSAIRRLFVVILFMVVVRVLLPNRPQLLLLRGGWASKRFLVVVRGDFPCCWPS